MKMNLLTIFPLLILSLFGCTPKDSFTYEKDFLESMRQLDQQHFYIEHKLPQKIDPVRFHELAEKFKHYVEFQKTTDQSVIDSYEMEIKKSLQNNQYKLQQIKNALSKVTSYEGKIQSLQKTLKDEAMDILEAMKKQYQTEIELTTYYIASDQDMLKYVEAKRKKIRFTPSIPPKPSNAPDAGKVLQRLVDGSIKQFNSQLNNLKKN